MTEPRTNVDHRVHNPHLLENPSFEQTLLARRHDEVVRVVLEIDEVLQVDARLVAQFQEKFRIEDVEEAGDLSNTRFLSRAVVLEVCSDGNGQLSSEHFPFEI